MRTRIAGGLIFLLAILSGVQAQQESSALTLQQAAKIALEKNPACKAALAETRASSAQIKTAQSYLLPQVTFSRAFFTATPAHPHSPENMAECEVLQCELTK